MSPPALPPAQPPELPPCVEDYKDVHFQLSFGSCNVASLYTGEHGNAGKVQLLRTQMTEFQFNFMGLQETRCPQICSFVDNVPRLGAGACKGHWGVELWLNLKQPIAHVDKTPLFLTQQDVIVVHQEPRILVVKVDHAIWKACLVVAHAPQSGQALEERCKWWEHFTTTLHRFDAGSPIYVMLDANAAPGQADNKAVGLQGFAETKNTPLLRQFLAEFDLCLPATFACHQGPRDTWISPQGDSAHCIDFVCVPSCQVQSCSLSRTVEEFELMNGDFDHKLVALQLDWHATHLWPRQGSTKVKHHGKTNFNRQSISRQNVAKTIAKIPVPEWSTDIDTHFQHYNQDLLASLSQCCPRPTRGPKKTFFTSELWTLRTKRVTAKKQLSAVRQRHRSEFLLFIFKAWTLSSESEDHGGTAIFFNYTTTLLCWKLKLHARLHAHAKALRAQLRQTRSRALAEALKLLPVHAPANEILQTVKAHIGPTNLKHLKRKTLPMLQDEEGQPCETPAQLLGRWIQFFGDMEGGSRMGTQEQWNTWRENLERFRQTQLQLSTDDLPTLTDLEIAFRRVPKHKASGLDKVPSDLCGCCPRELARQNYGALLKLVLHGQEFLGHKGGLLTPAHKGKGALTDPKAYRSLLVSSHIGKTLHRTVRQTQAHLLEAFMTRSQLGGKRKVPVTLGLHEARAYLRAAALQQQSAALLMVDLVEAFYRVLRPLALGSSFTDAEIAQLAQRLQLHPDVMHQLQQHLTEESAVAAAGMTPQAQRLLCAIHSDTFFKMPGQRDVCRTTIGSRPGDSFADVVFTFLLSRVLHCFREKLQQHDLLEHIGVDTEFDPFETNVRATHPQTVYSGPVWMDDLCVAMQASTAVGAITKAGVASSLLLDTLIEHAMSPNLSKGKTELLVSLRGRGVRRVKAEHFGPNSPGTLPVIGESQTFHITIVGEYAHLGGLLHHRSDHRKEMRRRVALAHQAFNTNRRHIFQNKDVELSKRVQLFESLVLSRLLYGSESWFLPDWRSKNFLHAAVIKLYRRLLRLPPDAAWLDDEICVELELPTPTELLRRTRLRYLCTLHQCEHTVSWRLLHSDLDWCNLVKDDLKWLWKQLWQSSALPDPETNLETWRYLWKFHPNCWKGLVRRAFLHSALQRKNDVLVRKHHAAFIAVIENEQVIEKSNKPEAQPLFGAAQSCFACLSCRRTFRSKAGEAAHMFRRHGMVSSLRWLFDTTACPSCLREYHTFGRLKAHLYANENCRRCLQNRPALIAPEAGVGSTENNLMEHRLNGLLPPLQGQGPFPAPCLRREVEDFDIELYAAIAECLLQHDVPRHRTELQQQLARHTISWTMCERTVAAFVANASLQDAQAFGYEDVQSFQVVMTEMMDPSQWEFMRQQWPDPTLPTREQLTQALDEAELCAMEAKPRAFGAHRLVLHAFSGRRRPGDFQEFLDGILEAHEGVVVHVISVDIILSAAWGDVTDPTCQRFWYHGVRSKYVIGYLAGPPCETWSQARAVATDERSEETHWQGPRVLRTLQDLWGKPCLAIREMRQILIGNQLLLFSFHMMLLLYVTGGCGALEHPAPPKDEEKASIWRTSIAQFLCSLRGVRRIDFAQAYWERSLRSLHQFCP